MEYSEYPKAHDVGFDEDITFLKGWKVNNVMQGKYYDDADNIIKVSVMEFINDEGYKCSIFQGDGLSVRISDIYID